LKKVAVRLFDYYSQDFSCACSAWPSIDLRQLHNPITLSASLPTEETGLLSSIDDANFGAK